MNNFDPQQASLLDILFAQRNKQYGAYMLRKYYNNRLSMALGITLLAVFLTFLLVGRFSSMDPMAALAPKDHDEVVIRPFEVPKEPIPPVAPPKAVRPPAPSIDFNQFRIVEDNEVKDPPPTMDEIGKKVISNTNSDVPGGEDRVDIAGPSGVPGGTSPAPAPVAPPEPTFVPHPSEAPYFPGGDAAWRAYLASHINVPGDMEPGEKRSVLIRFLVAEDGSVTAFEVMRSGGATFDNEVLRVLRKMPKWKPARQNGRAVATSFQQPVTFQAPED
jgi:periplasmic protein TonB